MKQNSDERKQWKEKALLLLKDGKEWAVQNKKISIPAAAVVLVILLACVSVLSGKKNDTTDIAETAQAGTELTMIPVPDVPLEENAVAPINELMAQYYSALADGDVDTLAGIKNYISDVERLYIEKKSNYIEKYENIVCYTKVGLTEDSYLVYAYNEAKILDIETAVPALNTFVVYKNENGEYYIYEGDLEDNVFHYFQELSGQDDVTNLCNTVQAKYNETIAEDEKLAEFMEQFPKLVEDEVAKALAIEQANAAEAVEAGATEETEEIEPEVEAPKAKVTEVETTDTVNVRSSDSQEADKVGRVPSGTRLPLIEKKENGWSKVEFEGKEAFIKSEYLSDVVTVVEEDESGSSNTGSQEETQSSNSVGTTVGESGKVTAKTTVNVRASANENGERLGVIYQGEKLELVMQQADGWCKVKYKGKTAYVKTEFVE